MSSKWHSSSEWRPCSRNCVTDIQTNRKTRWNWLTATSSTHHPKQRPWAGLFWGALVHKTRTPRPTQILLKRELTWQNEPEQSFILCDFIVGLHYENAIVDTTISLLYIIRSSLFVFYCTSEIPIFHTFISTTARIQIFYFYSLQ